MRGVVLVALALLVSAAFSGCVAEKDDPEVGSASGSSTSASKSGTPTKSATTTTSKAPSNKTAAPAAAPTANLTASTLNGTAPLNVTFTVSGTSATGNLSWVLSADGASLGNGTKVPANVTHAFTEAGNFTVLLSVFDGKRNATANVTVRVSAGAAAPSTEDTLCPTDEDAVEIPGAGYYLTPMDSAEDPPFNVGSMWVYEESNGLPGLQRNDDTRPTACPTPDTIVF